MFKKIFMKYLQLKQDSEDLQYYKEMVRRYRILLERISNKCSDNDYNMPILKFRKIKELAETDISKDNYDDGMNFWDEFDNEDFEDHIPRISEEEINLLEADDISDIPKITRKNK